MIHSIAFLSSLLPCQYLTSSLKNFPGIKILVTVIYILFSFKSIFLFHILILLVFFMEMHSFYCFLGYLNKHVIRPIKFSININFLDTNL